MGIGDWGLGPIPNPQSPIPNPQSPKINSENININNIKNIIKFVYNKLNVRKIKCSPFYSYRLCSKG